MSDPASPVADPSSYGPIQWEGASQEEAECVGRVVGRVQHFERGVGLTFRERCNRFYKQYRGFQQFQDAWRSANGRNDRDGLLYDAKKHWGAQLHIPLSYRTVETIVPRAIANMPKLLYLPRDEQWRKNLETVRLLIDSQQEQIDIDLPFQAVMRAGEIYGLGTGKTYWRTEMAHRRKMERYALLPNYVLGKRKPEVTFDDPMFEDVDPFDFMWDPFGSDMRTCEWVVHRIWLSTKACLQRVESESWDSPSAQKLNEDGIRKLGTSQRHYSEVWQERLMASGFSSWHFDTAGEHPHELLEFHDGEDVYSVLDRQVLVQEGENPCGEMPFQVFRPTPLGKQLVGIGSLEPVEHLQRELDTLRSQRRDSATISLNAGFAYDDAAIDPEDLVFGPDRAIPVSNARPADALFPLPVKDVPGSGYQEEAAILRDFDLVSGMTDALDNNPSGGQSSTATEAQLVQAALGRRIELGSRRFEIEVVRHVARCFLYLDQRMISTHRQDLVVPGQGESHEEAMTTGNWKKYPVGPGELAGEYEIVPEGGSMAARNVPQDRSDASMILDRLAHDWYINPTKARLRAMELMGIKHPQSWLRSPEPTAPLAAFRFLIEGGVDPQLVIQSVLRAREVTAPQEGPSANQVTEMMGAGGEGSQ